MILSFTVASPKINLNSTVSDNIGPGQTKYLNYPLPNNTQGITVVLNVTNGCYIVCINCCLNAK